MPSPLSAPNIGIAGYPQQDVIPIDVAMAVRMLMRI